MNLNDDFKENQNKEKNNKAINKEENNSNKIVLEDLNSKIKYNNFPPFQNNSNIIKNINKAEQIDELSESVKQQNLLKYKDKEIEELQIINRNEEIELNNLKKELSNLKKITNMNDYNNSKKTNSKETENKILDLENKYNELSKVKIEKEKELSDLLIKMKKSSDNLNKVSIKLEEINSENFSLKNLNNKLKEKKREKSDKKNELKLKMNKYIEIEITNSTENDNNNYDNNILDEELLYQKINDLKMKINEIEQIKNIYEDKKLDYKINKNLLNDYISKDKINKKILEEREEKLNNLVSKINNSINELTEWIIYSFGEIIECNEEQININKKEEKIVNEEILKDNDKYKPSLLYNCLMEKDEKIKNKYKLLKKRNDDLEQEYKEIYSKYIELQKLNDEYEEYIENNLKEKNKLVDELNTLKSFVNNLVDGNYPNEQENLENQNEQISQNEEKEKENINILKQEIENLNEKYHSMINEKNELEKKLNDIKEKELIHQEEKINQRNKDIIIIKNELDRKQNKNNKDFQNCDKKLNMYADQNAILKNNKIMLNKKLQSLLNEINLKNIQIKKQEEIKNHENEKINNFFNNKISEDINGENYNPNKKLIKDLELKRENLLYDNKLLIKENQDLRTKLKVFF